MPAALQAGHDQEGVTWHASARIANRRMGCLRRRENEIDPIRRRSPKNLRPAHHVQTRETGSVLATGRWAGPPGPAIKRFEETIVGPRRSVQGYRHGGDFSRPYFRSGDLRLGWDRGPRPRAADAGAVRSRVEALSRAGVDVAVVSGTHVGNVDGRLRARPTGPGRLYLCLNRGSEVFAVDKHRPKLVWRRNGTPDEEAGLDRAAVMTISRLAASGLTVELVSQRLNRRKIDLIPLSRWADPPKARIAELSTPSRAPPLPWHSEPGSRRGARYTRPARPV